MCRLIRQDHLVNLLVLRGWMVVFILQVGRPRQGQTVVWEAFELSPMER